MPRRVLPAWHHHNVLSSPPCLRCRSSRCLALLRRGSLLAGSSVVLQVSLSESSAAVWMAAERVGGLERAVHVRVSVWLSRGQRWTMSAARLVLLQSRAAFPAAACAQSPAPKSDADETRQGWMTGCRWAATDGVARSWLLERSSWLVHSRPFARTEGA